METGRFTEPRKTKKETPAHVVNTPAVTDGRVKNKKSMYCGLLRLQKTGYPTIMDDTPLTDQRVIAINHLEVVVVVWWAKESSSRLERERPTDKTHSINY